MLKFPSNILMLDPVYTHHILVVEKSTHMLHLFKNDEKFPTYLHSYKIATGATTGDKTFRGDKKTPEGIYQLTEFKSAVDLKNMYAKEGQKYGNGAFTLNYPNRFDQLKKKTGGGIWLHSTDDESRIAKGLDSRGCVVVAQTDLVDLSKYIELNSTPIVIVQDFNFLRKDSWEKNRSNIISFIDTWIKSWSDENINQYISHYHSQYSSGIPNRTTITQWKKYKKAVFSNPGSPIIKAENISALVENNYAVVSFQQHYKSNSINDVGKKTLYLKRDRKYQWKIITEKWNKISRNNAIAFTPSVRFFNNNSQKDGI
ncbi:L,D-transpeptidase family protein [Bacteriovoracaceae bacterium]|nr:L,D-transpeptidase family protein [Bacteriovoracaceae bacterium]